MSRKVCYSIFPFLLPVDNKGYSYSNRFVILQGTGDNLRAVNLIWLMILLWQPLGAQSQTRQTTMSPLEWVINDKDKRETLFNHLQVSQAQAAAFWRTYEDYESLRRALFKERVKLINKHAEVQTTAADREVRAIIRRLLENDVEYREMYKEYYGRIALIVGPQKALEFVHIEEYFQVRANIRLDSVLLKQENLVASKRILEE